MNRIILMRHAKSSWASAAQTDHERPLNDRGRRDAPKMAAELDALGWAPDLVISSDAERTRETWGRMSAQFPDAKVIFSRSLYHAGPEAIYDAVNEHAEPDQTVLLLGHNPGWEYAVGVMSGARETMTTANCALLQRDAPWDAPFARDFELVAMLRPRD